MNKRTDQKRRNRGGVALQVWIDPEVKERGQAAVKILKYGDMTRFITAKLNEAIEQASRQFAIKA